MRRSSWVVGIVLVLATPGVASALEVQWGRPGDVPVPADFDGDGYADYATWRPHNGLWTGKSSATGATWGVQWGMSGDVPVPGDYDDDGTMDFAVWRPSTGRWHVKSGATGAVLIDFWWGQSGDIPLPGDYDGDGRLDLAYWRPSTGYWSVKAATITYAVGWGSPGDVPVPGDYDGIPGDDFAYWRPSTGAWRSFNGKPNNIVFGPTVIHAPPGGDKPSAARFCSDTASLTLWGSGTGTWSTYGQPSVALGDSGYIPVAANYLGDPVAEYAVWRPWNATWYIQESTCDRWDPVEKLVDGAVPTVRGVTVAAIKDGAIVFSRGAGFATGSVPASPDQPWQVASISKLFIGTAALTLVDDGILLMDAPTGLLNAQNYTEPTLREFGNHTSSVNRHGCFFSLGGDPDPDLGVATACLGAPWWPYYMWWQPWWAQSGAMGDAAQWIDRLPGSVAEYSNIAAVWPARMVELATGIDFAAYTRWRIFDALDMTATGWFQHELPGQTLAEGHHVNGTPTQEYGVSPYPMGNLRASALDLARFMIMWTSDGTAPNGVQVLAPGTVATALTSPSTTSPFGFFWNSYTAGGRTLWWHNGMLAGVCANLLIDPLTREGVVVLANTHCDAAWTPMGQIWDRAFQTLGWL